MDEKALRILDSGEPGYWRGEVGGQLKPAVQRYLNEQPLTPDDITLIRLYLRQWVDSPSWDANPHHTAESRQTLALLRAAVRRIQNQAALDAWIEQANDFGINPL